MARVGEQLKTVYLFGFTEDDRDALLPVVKVFGVTPSLTRAKEMVEMSMSEDIDPDEDEEGEWDYFVEEQSLEAPGRPGTRYFKRSLKRPWEEFRPGYYPRSR